VTTSVLSASAQQILIQGEITNKNKGITSIALSYRDGRMPVKDTIKMDGNNFMFTGTVAQPVKAQLSAIDAKGQQNSHLEIYLSEDPITLKASKDLNKADF